MLQRTRGTAGLRSPGGWWRGAPVHPRSPWPWRVELSADPSQTRSWTCRALHLGPSDMWAGSFCVLCLVGWSAAPTSTPTVPLAPPPPPIKNVSGPSWSPLALLGTPELEGPRPSDLTLWCGHVCRLHRRCPKLSSIPAFARHLMTEGVTLS